MGVLVGTSLIVIIPEGVETLYTSNAISHSHDRRGMNVHTNHARWTHEIRSPGTDNSLPAGLNNYEHLPVPGTHAVEMPGPLIPDSIADIPKTTTEPGMVGALSGTPETGGSHEDNAHAWIGVALIAGFIMMFLVDKLPQYTTSSKPKARTHHIALNNLGGRFNLTTNLDREEESETFLENNQSTESRSRSFATTTGLVIHAAADGIALGASSSTSNTNLSLVIFFAIMVHKAPAAFGLTSILLRQGLSKRMARAHLVMFSLAAPVGATTTWIAARLLGANAAQNAQNTKWWTGILLLFSAGTFLYVAMHSMQEVTSGHHEESKVNGHVNGQVIENRDNYSQEPQKPSVRDLGAAIFGMILPLFLQVGHAH